MLKRSCVGKGSRQCSYTGFDSFWCLAGGADSRAGFVARWGSGEARGQQGEGGVKGEIRTERQCEKLRARGWARARLRYKRPRGAMRWPAGTRTGQVANGTAGSWLD